jgi:hypothetical protein
MKRTDIPKEHHPMKYLDRIRTEPSLWVLMLMAGGATAAFLYLP